MAGWRLLSGSPDADERFLKIALLSNRICKSFLICTVCCSVLYFCCSICQCRSYGTSMSFCRGGTRILLRQQGYGKRMKPSCSLPRLLRRPKSPTCTSPQTPEWPAQTKPRAAVQTRAWRRCLPMHELQPAAMSGEPKIRSSTL